MAKRKSVSEADASLFRDAVGPVKPVRDDRVHPERRQPGPRPARRDDEPATGELPAGGAGTTEPGAGERLLFYRPGLQPRMLRKLRRGQLAIEAELDLHGMVIADAARALARFLEECRERNRRCVRVIHGKGLRSPDGRGAIKSELDGWLRRRAEVLAYASARPADGGTGAVYVLLKAGG